MNGRTAARRVLGGLLVALCATAACSSSNDKAKDGNDALPARTTTEPAGPRLHEKPFTCHFDALLTRFMPHGEFAPGVDALWAPIHSGVNATLYFMALRGPLPRYVNAEHEETFFIVSGTGTLDLADGKRKPIEGGFVVKVPPRFAHGFTGTREDPLFAVVIVAPTVNRLVAEPAEHDLPDATGVIYCQDVIPQVLEPPPGKTNFAARKPIDSSKHSTIQLAAVQRERIPNHKHHSHDEIVVLFFQQGMGFLRLDEVVHPTQAVQIAYIPAGTTHFFEHQADGQARAVSIFTPGYDGTDVEWLDESKIPLPEAPNGYRKTSATGDWVDPDKDKRPEIKLGSGNPGR